MVDGWISGIWSFVHGLRNLLRRQGATQKTVRTKEETLSVKFQNVSQVIPIYLSPQIYQHFCSVQKSTCL